MTAAVNELWPDESMTHLHLMFVVNCKENEIWVQYYLSDNQYQFSFKVSACQGKALVLHTFIFRSIHAWVHYGILSEFFIYELRLNIWQLCSTNLSLPFYYFLTFMSYLFMSPYCFQQKQIHLLPCHSFQFKCIIIFLFQVKQAGGLFSPSVLMPFQGIFCWYPQAQPKNEGYRLYIEKSIIQPEIVWNGFLSATSQTVTNTSHLFQTIINNAARGARLICIELTGQEQHQHQFGVHQRMPSILPFNFLFSSFLIW